MSRTEYSRPIDLCGLKNHEVLDFFWRALRSQQAYIAGEFTDITALQAALDEQSISDEELEKIFYGDSRHRRYSGWTTEYLVEVLESLGQKNFKCNPKPGGQPWEKEFEFIPSAVTGPLKRSFIQRRLSQKVWDFRKRLRLNAVYLKGRISAAWAPTELREQINLNLGAGEEVYEGYTNVDWAGRQHIYDNIVGLRKFSDSSVDKIYSNHVLEHIPQSCIEPMLKRWLKVLKSGGVVVARAPDARVAAQCVGRAWQEASPDQIKSFGFPNYLAKEAALTGTLDTHSCFQTIFGWSASTPYSWDDSNQHKSLWTPDLTRARFERAGFRVEWCGHLGTLQTAIVARRY